MTRVCCAIILKEDRILAVQRSEHMSHPLKWEFPGGKIQEGESEESCILRELEEELKLLVFIIKRLNSVFHQYGEKSIELIPFIVSTEKDPELTEHKALQWLTKDELRIPDWVEADIKVITLLNKEWSH